MSPPVARAWAFAAVLVLLAQPALGQVPPEDPTGGVVLPGPPPKPDLVPGNLQVFATDQRNETKVCGGAVNAAPRNATALQFDVKLWIERREGEAWSRAHERVARSDAIALGGGERFDFCANFTLLAGAYRANLHVDSANETDESNETNNARSRDQPFFVKGLPAPDLRIAYVGVSPPVSREGESQLVFVTVHNVGDAAANASWLDVSDETGLLQRHKVPALPARRAATFTLVTYPDDRPPGDYRVRTLVDALDNVSESDESNNEGLPVPYRVNPHPAPDLRIEGGALDGPALARRALRYEATLVNEGNRTATNVTVQLLIDDKPVGSFTTGLLDPGAATRVEFFFVLAEGNHTLRLVADPVGVLAEIEEDDNAFEALLEVAAQPEDLRLPNLVVERVGFAPDDPGPGETVNVTALVHNLGTARSNATSLAVYQGGRKLGAVKVPALDPDRYYSARYAWAPQPPGAYALRMLVDPDNLAPEGAEDDNNHTLHLTLRAPPSPPASAPPPPIVPIDEGDDDAPPPSTTFEPPAVPPGVEISQIQVGTRAVPGGAKGTLTAQLRNPSLDPLGRLVVAFRVDGQLVKEVLVEGIQGAATATASTGEVDLPAGAHEVAAEARIAGQTDVAARATKSYAQAAGERSLTPGAGVVGLLVAAACGSLLLGARRHR